MKLEDQVANLELSRRLKELGVKQDSLLFWIRPKPKNGRWRIVPANKNIVASGKAFSAFTVAELGELLPDSLGSPPKQFDWETYKTNGKYQVQVSDYVERIPHLIFCANMDTEADARAGALIYLLEKNLVTP